MLRSLLFIPGSTPNKLIHIGDMGADAVILDLEDAVSPDEKDAARILVRNTIMHMRAPGLAMVVRINAIDTPYWKSDVLEIAPMRPDMLMPPKVNAPEDVLALDTALAEVEAAHGMERGTVGLLPLIETALGVENAFRIASASPRVRGMLLGAEDLTADLRCKRTKRGDEIMYARTRLVCAARAAHVEVFDTPFTDVNDDEGARQDAETARLLGFSGKSAISPRHIPFINEAFSPSEAEISYAYEVLEAIENAKAQGRGVISLHGKMIDAPIVSRARRVAEAADALGLGKGGVRA